MLDKMFTTKMSANKKHLQNRFAKIRSNIGIKSKLISAIIFCILVVGIIAISVIIALNTYNSNKVNSLFKLKHTELNNIQNIEKIVNLTNFTPYDFHSIEISDKEYRKRIAVKFMVDDRANHRIVDDVSCRKLSAVILALVPEAEAVSCFIFDNYSEDTNIWDTSFYSTYVSRYDFYTWDESTSNITNEYIINATSTTETFNEFYDRISDITDEYELSDFLKQKYDFIGNDYEVVLNSGIGADFLVDEEFLNTNEYTQINNIFNVDVADYKGYALKINKFDIRNFKTNEYKKHILLYYPEGDKAVIINQQIIESGEKSDEVKALIQKLMSVIKDKYIENAENMYYTQIRALQYQVNQGHFPWRLDPVQVINMFLTSIGEETVTVRLPETTSDKLTYEDGNIKIELYKPLDKSEKGIWIVRSYTKL